MNYACFCSKFKNIDVYYANSNAMIRKDRIKTAKATVRSVVNSKLTATQSQKFKFGQVLDPGWPIEDDYFFEAEDY